MGTQFRNARIWDEHQAFHLGDLWVDEGVFVHPGASASERIDLKGGWVVPALWDSHLHLLLLARSLGQLDLSDCRNKGELLERLPQVEGEWVEGFGWNESNWSPPDLPDLEELDRACGGRPCWLTRSDLHSGLTNSEGLRRAKIGPSPVQVSGGSIVCDALGRPTGQLADQAMKLIEKEISPPDSVRLGVLLRRVCSQLHRHGIAGVCDQRLKDCDDFPQAWSLYRDLQMPLRIHCNRAAHEDLQSGPRFLEGDDWLRCGHVKFFADGSLGSRTARMFQNYQGTQERGLWLTEPHDLEEGFARVHSHGFPVSVHAIGDEAVATVCALLQGHPLDRVEHLQILNDQVLVQLRPEGPVASMQPLHLLDDRVQADQLLGDRARGYYRLASLRERGVRLSFGSDAPVASFDPWLGLQAACLRQRNAGESAWYERECLAREAALWAYTGGACASLGWQNCGRLRPGFLADFCVLDRNPLDCPWPAQVRVLRTVVGGKTQFSL